MPNRCQSKLPFEPRELYAAGVLPFRINVGLREPPPRVGEFTLISAISTQDDFPNAQEFCRLRRRLFKAQHDWPGPEPETHIYCREDIIIDVENVARVPFRANEKRAAVRFPTKLKLTPIISLFNIGFGSLAFWVDLPDREGEPFGLETVICLAELCRNTDPPAVNGTLNGKESDSVFNIVRLLLENFTAELLRRIQNDQGIRIQNDEATSNGIRFCYPVLYIGAMRGTQNIDEVKTAHRRRLTAIVNFLHDYPETLKEVEFEGFVTDVHPYEYAMTLITGGITLEVHSELQPQTGHLLELQQTLIVSEFPVIELFALRYYNETISQLLSKPLQGVQSITAGIAVIGLYISVLAALTGGRKAAVAFLLITGAAYLAASVISNLVRKRKLVFSVTLLRNKQILRDTYLQRTLDQYGEVFPIQDLLASLTQKLAALDGIFDSFFRIGIAVVTILFALFAATWLDFDVERALGDIGSLFRRLAGY